MSGQNQWANQQPQSQFYNQQNVNMNPSSVYNPQGTNGPPMQPPLNNSLGGALQNSYNANNNVNSTQYHADEEYRRLVLDFKTMDQNGDGRVDRNEMINFLTKKNIEADHRDEIVDEIFRKCDADGNGFIDLQEFVRHYLDIKNQLL